MLIKELIAQLNKYDGDKEIEVTTPHKHCGENLICDNYGNDQYNWIPTECPHFEDCEYRRGFYNFSIIDEGRFGINIQIEEDNDMD